MTSGTTRPGLRVLTADVHRRRGEITDLAEVSQLIREADPDVAVVTGTPWRLRTRTRAADLAARSALVSAAGSPATVGNLVLVNLRVRVLDTWCVQFPLVPGSRLAGAVLVRCAVGAPGAGSFVVAGTRLSTTTAARAREAAILARVLSEVDDPVILAGTLAGTALTGDRVQAAAAAAADQVESVGIVVSTTIGVRARHHARRGQGVAATMADLLLPGPTRRSGPTGAG